MTLNKILIYNQILRIIVISLLFCFVLKKEVSGQQNDVDTLFISSIQPIDSLSEIADFSYMNIDFCYTNNKINSRREEIKNVPGIFGNLSFNHKTGIYSRASFINFPEASINTNDYDVTLGYQKDIKNLVDFDLYYSYHGFKGDTIYRGINYKQSIGLSIGLTLKSLYFFAEGYYYFGKTENYFLDIGISGTEQFSELLFKNDYLILQPTASIAYGTDFWLYENMGPLRKKYVLYILDNRGFDSEKFEYQGIDLILPINYSIGDFSVLFAWMYYIPSDKFKFMGWTNQTGYMISLSYTLNFN